MQPDKYGRRINYLRMSLTDRCNLRCFYCRSGQDLKMIPHDDVLRYEELLSLAEAAAALGVRKVRLTGGEPLVRRDFLPFLERLVQRIPGIDVRLTTNATLLKDKLPALQDLGLKRVNISLDTLKRSLYEEITRRDHYHDVRDAIDACVERGIKVKLNAVALRGINDKELPDFIELARTHPIEIRFIEFMPMGGTDWSKDNFWSAKDIIKDAEKHADLEKLPRGPETDGPATRYAIKDGLGGLGVISPLSNHFCESCNRLRITSDGRLRTCLFSDKEYRLRPLLRHPAITPEHVKRVIQRAAKIKPLGNEILQARQAEAAVCKRVMSGIGG